MKIAIVHYHLRPGGVTRVIEETCAALTVAQVGHVVLTDSIIPALGYGSGGDADSLAAALRATAAAALGTAPDAWIFHNPTLGKNRSLPAAIERLARDGESILLHIHDLAEDGRPQNFANIADPARLHFTAPRVHHAFLNARDLGHFLAIGLPAERGRVLPNPVAPVEVMPAADCAHPLVFYPVRGIRRKNLGEACLLAALAPPGSRFAISRAPENPAEFAAHDFWQAFAFSRYLPITFAVVGRISPSPGAPPSFDSWCRHATHWLSTSLAEGFGLTLAEAAARRVPLIARRLDPGFVPSDTRGIYQKITVSGTDFAALDEAAQAAAIDHLLAAKDDARIDGHPARDWLRQRLEDRTPPAPDPQLAAHAPQAVAAELIGWLETLRRQPAAAPTFLPQAALAARFGHASARPAVPTREAFPRAVIFDVYGTLLAAPSGRIRPDPAADSAIRAILEHHQLASPPTPSAALADLVARDHARSPHPHPEIDLAALWAGLLEIPNDASAAALVAEIEDAWHPATPMPGALDMLRRLAAAGIPCGLLSNAQANVWHQLGPLAPAFAADLCVFSHQFGIAKPSPVLFREIASRLARRGIQPHQVWFIGNDPAHDIQPAAAVGFRTILFGAATSPAETWETFAHNLPGQKKSRASGPYSQRP